MKSEEENQAHIRFISYLNHGVYTCLCHPCDDTQDKQHIKKTKNEWNNEWEREK